MGHHKSAESVESSFLVDHIFNFLVVKKLHRLDITLIKCVWSPNIFSKSMYLR